MKRPLLTLFALLAACSPATTNPAGDAGSATDAVSTTDVPAATDVGAGGRRPATVALTGTANGALATAADVAYETSTSGCGGATGIRVATSGAAIACGAPLGTSIAHPYLQLRLSRADVGTYALVAEGACTATTTDRVFTVTWDGATGASLEGTSGSLTITAVGDHSVSATFNVTLSGAANVVAGSFVATACP